MHHIKPQIIKTNGKNREGRGFSREELKKAGINLQEAKAIELPIDMRRKTAHDINVEAIKEFAEQEKTKRKPKPKSKEAESAARAKKRKA